MEAMTIPERLPNAKQVYIPEGKVENYLLCLEHAVGGAKARFLGELGYTRQNTDLLKQQLLLIAKKVNMRKQSEVAQGGTAVKELDTVVLTHDVAEYGLVQGDVGAVVHCYADGHTYEVEFVSADGRTVALLTLTDADIRPLREGELSTTKMDSPPYPNADVSMPPASCESGPARRQRR